MAEAVREVHAQWPVWVAVLPEEAAWLARATREHIPNGLGVLLNVGSGDDQMRERIQPHQAQLMEVLDELADRIVHTDLVPGPGVDAAGDLCDNAFIKELSTFGIDSVLCANLLEHVDAPEALAHNLAALVPKGGYLIVSVPRDFPYHAAPQDNGLRPDPETLAAMFPGCEVVASECVASHRYAQYFLLQPSQALRSLVRAALPYPPMRNWKTAAAKLPWMFRRFTVSCVVLQKRH